MKIVPNMPLDDSPFDGVYELPDGRVFRVQPIPYFRRADPVEYAPQPVEVIRHAFTVEGLENRIAELLTQESLQKFGKFLVERELEWAESELQKLLASQGSSMAPGAATESA